MQELLQAALSPANIVYSLLLVVVFLYWLLIIVGAFDIGAFEMEVDTNADLETGTATNAGGSGAGWLAGALHFFNFGKLPFMLILSFVVFFCWAFSILSHYYIGHGSLLFSLAIIFPGLFVSLILTKLITTPLVPIFKNLDTGEEEVDYIGNDCILTTPANPAQGGQAQVTINNNTLLINVKVSERKPEALYKGDKAIIVGMEKEKKFYIIEKE